MDPSAGGTIRWRKSSYSGEGNNECVEIAHSWGEVRDSKNSTGPTLKVDVHQLIATIKGQPQHHG